MPQIVCPLCTKTNPRFEEELPPAVYCTGCSSTIRLRYEIADYEVWDSQQKNWQIVPNLLDK